MKRAFNPELEIQGIVLTMFDKRNTLSTAVADDELEVGEVLKHSRRAQDAPRGHSLLRAEVAQLRLAREPEGTAVDQSRHVQLHQLLVFGGMGGRPFGGAAHVADRDQVAGPFFALQVLDLVEGIGRAASAARRGAGQHQPPDATRMPQHQFLGDHAAERDAQHQGVLPTGVSRHWIAFRHDPSTGIARRDE